MDSPDSSRRCAEHGLAVGADDQCVICRRAELSRPGPRRSSGGPVIVGVILILATVGAVAFFLNRRGGPDAATRRESDGERSAAASKRGVTSKDDVGAEVSIKMYMTSW